MKSKSIEQRIKESAFVIEYHQKMIYPLSVLAGMTETYLLTKDRRDREMYLAMAEPVFRMVEDAQKEYNDQVVAEYLAALEEMSPSFFNKLKGKKK